MKQITIISGKGGTGKTVLTASFAVLAKNAVLVDCDVDAADLHLLLKPEVQETHEFKSGVTARIDKDICTECGACIDACRFNAINTEFIVDAVSCEGCAVCNHVCPADAIRMEENLSGEWYISNTKYGPMVHARLGIAEENSGKLVSRIRKKAREIAKQENLDFVIVDGPPGIGCPVVASLSGVDMVLIVTEPTLSGMHDMARVADVTKHFSIPTAVVINKYDINLENTEAIHRLCNEKNIKVLARLPFSLEVVKSVVHCVPIIEFCHNSIAKQITDLWNNISS